MSKIDIRLRRRKFTEGRIQQFKNYQSVLEKHKNEHRRKVKGIALLAFILLLIMAILATFLNENKPENKKDLPDTEVKSTGPQSLNFE